MLQDLIGIIILMTLGSGLVSLLYDHDDTFVEGFWRIFKKLGVYILIFVILMLISK